jgi:N-acyl homoserine lactone hydrolase
MLRGVVGGSGVPPPSGRTARRLYPLFCGYELIDVSVSLRGQMGTTIAAPVGCFLVETDSGYVLIDSGSNEELIWDPLLCTRYYARSCPPVVRPGDTLLERLASVKVDRSQISHVIVSHLHGDHGGGIRHFPQAKIVIQRPEYNWAMSLSDPASGYFRCDWDLPTTRWQIVEGDVEVAPGVTALAAYGHTPGHQAALVELERTGAVLIPGDAGDMVRNFTEEIGPGGATDIDAAMAAIRRLNAVRAERHALLYPGHDLAAWQSLRQAPDFYD